MKPYNVEIFNQDFTLIANTNINTITYQEDYLSPVDNAITVQSLPGISKQNYLFIKREEEEYAGVITEIAYGKEESKALQTITYKPLLSLFDSKMLFDTKQQGVGSIEAFIAQSIADLFLNNADQKQNIKGLRLIPLSETVDWSFHITPSEKGGQYHLVNLLSSVIIPALSKFGIKVATTLCIQRKQIEVRIFKVREERLVIESNLPNIIKKNIVIKQVREAFNKLVVYDTADNYRNPIIYYLHPDLNYDLNDVDRMLPVKSAYKSVTSDEETSFVKAAREAAAETFGNLSFQNLIELTLFNNDALIHPEMLEIGQQVYVLSDGISYHSMLTGREIGTVTKLIFGTIRLELTKILRRDNSV